MTETNIIVLIACLLSLGCSAPRASTPAAAAAPSPTPPAPTAPPASSELRLIARGEDLYLTRWPEALPRTAMVYVRDPVPLTAGSLGPIIGAVTVTEPASSKVSWYCAPTQPKLRSPPPPGLPAQVADPDTKIRVGKCLGEYRPVSASALKQGDVVELVLELGAGDHVEANDMYAIFGEARGDFVSRAVVLPQVGSCTVVPHAISDFEAKCELQRTPWPELTDAMLLRGGVVKWQPPAQQGDATGEGR